MEPSPTEILSRGGDPAAFSLTELVVVVAVIAIFATIAIPMIVGVIPSSSQTMAKHNQELLNRALRLQEQTGAPLGVAAASGTADEIEVLDLLQTPRASLTGGTATALIPSSFPRAVSSSTNDHRLQWTGQNFRLLPPGTVGGGLKMGFDASSGTNP